MKVIGKNQEIGPVTTNRVNKVVSNTSNATQDIYVAGANEGDPDKAFVISVVDQGKLKARTVAGEIALFDFLPGDDCTLYDRIYSDAANTIVNISIRY